MTELHDNVEKEETENLIPYSNNPKSHPTEQIDKIASSIKNYGFIQPIVVDQDNEVIIGHGRLQAARKLELDNVPVIKKDDLSESEAKALRLADNRIAETDWEQEKLAVELEQLTEEDDFEELIHGFNEDEMSEYLDSLTDKEDLEEPDTPDVEEIETDIEEGEVFKLGEHRLMCGDATNEEHVETLMDGETADMVFTDPPYGKGGYAGRSGKHEEVENDDLSKKEIQRFYELPEAREIYLCIDYEGIQILYDAQGIPDSLIVWDKGHFGMGDGYRRQYELIGYYGEFTGTTDSDVWKINRENSEYQHPTQKPVELPARAIQNSSNQGDIVLDLFAGSGSTLLAAEQTNRKAYCIELEPKYCQVIINRWEDLTNKEAEKIEA